MKIVTRQQLTNGAVDRWREQYFTCRGEWYDDRKQTIWEKLKALGSSPDPADVDRVIGNGSWTRITCDNCGRYPEIAIEMGSHSDDEYGPCNYCRKCVDEAISMIANARGTWK